MKKWLSFMIVVTMISGLLAGCQSNEKETVNTEDNVKTEVIKLQMSIAGSENDEAIYRERLDLAEKELGNVEVELLYIPKEYSTKVQTMMAADRSPDILQVLEEVHGYSALGQIRPLDDLVKTSGVDLEKRFGTAHQTYIYKNQLFAMPDRGGSMIVYYNKDLFDAAGVGYPNKNWTWDDMLDAAKKLTVRTDEGVEVYGFAAGDWWPWWLSFVYQNGGRILDENNKVVINSPETIEALEFYNDLVFKHGVAPSLEEYGDMGNPGPDPLFAQGKVAFEITGFWNIGSLNKVEGLNWDIAPMWKQKQGATVAFGSGLAISKSCEHPEEAYKVIEYLTSVPGQMPIVTNKQDAPANRELLESDDFLKADFSETGIYMETFAESADSVVKLPLGPHWNELTEITKNHLSELFMNTKDAATVVEEMQEELEAAMLRY